MQTYVIMKPTGTEAFGTNDAYRDVLFRWGNSHNTIMITYVDTSTDGRLRMHLFILRGGGAPNEEAAGRFLHY